MTNYKSVVNTAKNNKLIRAELREFVLCKAITEGLYKNSEIAQQLYPDSPIRQKQCRLLSYDYKWDQSSFMSFNVPIKYKNLFYFTKWVNDVLKVYYKPSYSIYLNGTDGVIYDTKKFRIYYDWLYKDLSYLGNPGEREVRLSKISQYLWTPLWLILLVRKTIINNWNSIEFGNVNLLCVCLSATEAFQDSSELDNNFETLKNYLNNVCGLPVKYYHRYDADGFYIDKEEKQFFVSGEQNCYEFLDFIYKAVRDIKIKLYNGGYITLSSDMEEDL